MVDERAFLKLPINFQDKLHIFPPSVNEVIGNDKFDIYKNILTMSQEEIEDFYVAKELSPPYPTPLEMLLNNCFHDKQYELNTKTAFQFFIKQNVTFLYEQKAILVGDLQEQLQLAKTNPNNLNLLTEDNFLQFQNCIRRSLGEKEVEPPDPDMPDGKKKMLAAARYRDKLKAQKGEGLKRLALISSICCMGIGITPLNIGELSFASLGEILKRHQAKDTYETHIKSVFSLAGAKNKEKVPYWISNLKDD